MSDANGNDQAPALRWPTDAPAPAAHDPVATPAERAYLDAQGYARERDKYPPWDSRHQVAQRAFQRAIGEQTAAQEAAASAPPPPQTEHPMWAFGSPRDVPTAEARAGMGTLQTALRDAGVTTDEALFLADDWNKAVLRHETKSPADPGEPERRLRGMWGANFDRNLALVQAEVRRLGPGVTDLLETTGFGNSVALAHVLLSAARRHGRAPW